MKGGIGAKNTVYGDVGANPTFAANVTIGVLRATLSYAPWRCAFATIASCTYCAMPGRMSS